MLANTTTTNPSRSNLRAQGRLLLAGTAAYSLSTLLSAMNPIMLARFMQQTGVSESTAGWYVAMPFVGLASASLFAHSVVHRWSYTARLVLFAGLLIISELTCAIGFTSGALVITAQFCAGLAVGILLSMMSQLISQQAQAVNLFGFVNMVAVLMMSLMVSALGFAVHRAGLQGGYVLAATICLGLSLFIATGRNSPAVTKGDASSPSPAQEALVVTMPAVATVVMGVLFVSSSGLGFSFMFNLAQQLDMDYAMAGQIIGALLFVSAFACWAGGWCSGRFGPIRPLACAFLCSALGWYVAINTGSATTFFIALIPSIFALQFCFPVLLATAAALDRTGSWAAVSTPLITSGFAWGAIAAGFIVERWGLEALANAAVLGIMLCLGLLLLVRQNHTQAIT